MKKKSSGTLSEVLRVSFNQNDAKKRAALYRRLLRKKQKCHEDEKVAANENER